MKAVVIHGGPRKNWNTDLLCQKFIAGAAAGGAETQLFSLYDLDFKGCRGCLSCKFRNNPDSGLCRIPDSLRPVLEAVDACDILVLASPVYYHNVTGEMRSFMERLFFPYTSYDDFQQVSSSAKQVLMLYTMNVDSESMEKFHYPELFSRYESLLRRFFQHCETFYSTQTLQTMDYSKYHMSMFDENARKLRRESVFPQECEAVYAIGHRMALAVAGEEQNDTNIR